MAKHSEEEELLMTLLPESSDSIVLIMSEDEEDTDLKKGTGRGDAKIIPRHASATQHQRHRKPSTQSKLQQAAELGDEKTLQALVNGNIDVGLRDASGQSPLHLAAKGLHYHCCQILLTISSKEVNQKDNAGNTPLLLSISSGNMSFNISKLLISKGAKVNIENRGKKTALHIAAEKGNSETLELLINKDKSCIERHDAGKQTPLHLAVKHGQRETCRILLSAGANTEAKDIGGYTPLHWAAKKGFIDCIKTLTGSKCNVNCTDYGGNTPLHLLCVSVKDKGDCAVELLNQGANIYAQNNKGETPFHLAQCSTPDIRKPFHGKPLNLLLKDYKGRTVLHCAASRGQNSNRVDFILSLDQLGKIDAEHFINILDEDGYSALHMAVIKGEISTCRSLVKAGADGNIICDNKGNALHLAAEKGFDYICDFLISKGVKVNVKNNQSFTSLHLAAKNGHATCCEILIKRGAQISETDAGGNTALHHAADGNHIECCKIFITIQPTLINRFNTDGRTPLHLAVKKKSIACCKVLVTNKTDLWASESAQVSSPIKLALEFPFILKFLLESCGRTSRVQSQRDIDFRKFLEDSLQSSNREVAEIIISCCYWEESLQPYWDVDEEKEKRQNENLRLLVKKCPSLVEGVFDKCLPPREGDGGEDMKETSLRRYKLFYIDDISIESNTKEIEATTKTDLNKRLFSEDIFDPSSGALLCEVRKICSNRKWRRNHVLSCLIDQGQSDSLAHPLVITWIKYKWYRYIRWIHNLFVLLAFTIATLLTIYSMEAWSWQDLYQEWHINQSVICSTGEQLVGPEVFPFLREKAFATNVLAYSILGFLGFWLLHDVYKLFMLRRRYFTAETLAFLVCAIASVLFLGNFTHCTWITYMREDWQWIVGYVAIFSAWILTYYLYSTHPTRPPILDFSGFFLAAQKVLIPEIPIIILVIVIFAMIPKGNSSLRHVFENVKKEYGDLSSFGALIIIILVVVVAFRMFRSRDDRIDSKDHGNRLVIAVSLILDYDLLYPCFRRMFYKAWLSVDEEQTFTGCLDFSRCYRPNKSICQSKPKVTQGSLKYTDQNEMKKLLEQMQTNLNTMKDKLGIK